MVRATPSRNTEKDGGGASAVKSEELESRRLRDFAFSRSLLSRQKAQAQHPLQPSKVILNSDGKDIIKKGNRKSKYLFAFPGLMAPVAGGKLGELTNLDSKNPILYVDFPQGRLKLFGTIVYPKNKYLTLHFVRGSGNIVCEDCFESLVVFSVAWWVGTKEDNPEEARLPLPKHFEQAKHDDFNFTGGAGSAKDLNVAGELNQRAELVSPPMTKAKAEASESSSDELEAQAASHPVRQSTRTAGKKLRYADASSDEEDDDNVIDSEADTDIDNLKSGQTSKGAGKRQFSVAKEAFNTVNAGANAAILLDSDEDTPRKKDMNTSSQRRLSPKLEAGETRAVISVMKQSTLEVFAQKPDLQEKSPPLVHEASTPKKLKRAAFKGLKRVAKSLDVATSEDDSGCHAETNTPPKGRKRVKSGSSMSTKSRKEKVVVEGTPLKGAGKASEGKKSVRPKTAARKPSKGAFDSDAELSISNEGSDDSDEDWVG